MSSSSAHYEPLAAARVELVNAASAGHPETPAIYSCAYDGLLGPSNSARIIEVQNKRGAAAPNEVAQISREADALAHGKWTPETRADFQKLFADLVKSGADTDQIFDRLQARGVKINEQAEKTGGPNHINLAMIQKEDGSTEYYFVMTGRGIDNKKSFAAISQGRGSDAVAKVGVVPPKKPNGLTT